MGNKYIHQCDKKDIEDIRHLWLKIASGDRFSGWNAVDFNVRLIKIIILYLTVTIKCT